VSELVQTLWFENVSFLNEQILDTPVGRFSLRQMGIFLIFGLLAWVASIAFTDLVLKIVVAGAIFFSGAALFTRKIKTVSPETHLLYVIRKCYLQIKHKHSITSKGKLVEQTSSDMLLSATLGVPHVERTNIKQTAYKQQKPPQTTNTKDTNKPVLFIKYNDLTYKIANNL